MKSLFLKLLSGSSFLPVLGAMMIFSTFSCRTVAIKREIRTTHEIASIGRENMYIKAHMKDGTVYILHDWAFNQQPHLLTGLGKHMDINRRLIEERYPGARGMTGSPFFTVSIDDIALIETNDPGPSVAGPLAVVTGMTAAMAVFCIINPKACFGSCPTFYASNGDSLKVMAEGFSSSVLPSREDNDIDMLYHAVPGKTIELKLTNEALETHVIRYANLLIVEKNEGERVFATPGGKFLVTRNIIPPSSCEAFGGPCLQEVLVADGKEYFSTSDPDDLNTREEIFLRFNMSGAGGAGDNAVSGIITDTGDNEARGMSSGTEESGTSIMNGNSGGIGLVIGKRQTLLTTYLFYQSLAYMGHSATYWMAETERGSIYPETVYEMLGGIEVYRKSAEGHWIYEGEVNEHGPIATDYNIIPLSATGDEIIELKLVMTRGLWRINYLALASVQGETEPVVVRPEKVQTINGSEEDPLDKLTDQDDFLVTYPGDIYNISYELPFENAELFLESKGYYLEWIRDEWVIEQSFRNTRLLARSPGRYLKREAKRFKELEPYMEETFWNSRYVEK